MSLCAGATVVASFYDITCPCMQELQLSSHTMTLPGPSQGLAVQSLCSSLIAAHALCTGATVVASFCDIARATAHHPGPKPSVGQGSSYRPRAFLQPRRKPEVFCHHSSPALYNPCRFTSQSPLHLLNCVGCLSRGYNSKCTS